MVLHAYLIPARAGDFNADVTPIVTRANGRLAQHQRVATASWWPEPDFPRTSTLKVRRHQLPPPTDESLGRAMAPPVEGDPFAEALAAAAHLNSVRDDQTLAELGLDSMGLVELAAQLEDRTGRALAEGQLSTELTVARLRQLVAAAPLAEERIAAELEDVQPLPVPAWVYAYGWLVRPILTAPFDLLYRLAIPRTV